MTKRKSSLKRSTDPGIPYGNPIWLPCYISTSQHFCFSVSCWPKTVITMITSGQIPYTLWLFNIAMVYGFSMAHRNRCFTYMNSMVDLSMAKCECHNQMVPCPTKKEAQMLHCAPQKYQLLHQTWSSSVGICCRVNDFASFSSLECWIVHYFNF